MEIILEDDRVKMEEEDAERLRRGDREEGIDRDSAWVKDMKWVSHFGDRELVTIAEATDWLGSKAGQARETPRRSGQQQASEEDNAAAREKELLARLSESFTREVGRCRWRISCVPKETLQKLQGITADTSMGLPFGQSGTESSIRK